MSRGPGLVQRFVLERTAALREAERANGDGKRDYLTAIELATELAGGEPTAARLESMRRAIRTLAASGKLDRWHVDRPVSMTVVRAVHYPDRTEYWQQQSKAIRATLAARWPLDEDEAEAERQDRAKRLAEIEQLFRGRLGH